MLALSFCAAFAGVYTEYLLKFTEDNVHYQNMEQYAWGVVICSAQFIHSASSRNFFEGYTPATWLVILTTALYGQVVAFTLKFADNIVKVYANSLASLASALLSHFLFGAALHTGLLS